MIRDKQSDQIVKFVGTRLNAQTRIFANIKERLFFSSLNDNDEISVLQCCAQPLSLPPLKDQYIDIRFQGSFNCIAV